MNIGDLFNNYMLMSGIVAWMVAQVLKVVIFAIQNNRLELLRIFGDGGMPSGHSATVSALATASVMSDGFGSASFAITFLMAIIVMHDAMVVRFESGRQAHVINELIEYLRTEALHFDAKRLKELLGHTPLQVISGALLGIATALIMYQL